MPFQKILVPVLGIVILAMAFQNYGWPGLALVTGIVVMWILLNFNRMMQVMKRAAQQPIGYVASAVMLNAKLKPGVNLMHVVAMTRALGALQSSKDEQPEVFRWTDSGGSYVDVTLHGGKVVHWQMTRPTEAVESVDTLPAP
jgi:hypothetical protein